MLLTSDMIFHSDLIAVACRICGNWKTSRIGTGYLRYLSCRLEER